MKMRTFVTLFMQRLFVDLQFYYSILVINAMQEEDYQLLGTQKIT